MLECVAVSDECTLGIASASQAKELQGFHKLLSTPGAAALRWNQRCNYFSSANSHQFIVTA